MSEVYLDFTWFKYFLMYDIVQLIQALRSVLSLNPDSITFDVILNKLLNPSEPQFFHPPKI